MASEAGGVGSGAIGEMDVETPLRRRELRSVDGGSSRTDSSAPSVAGLPEKKPGRSMGGPPSLPPPPPWPSISLSVSPWFSFPCASSVVTSVCGVMDGLSARNWLMLSTSAWSPPADPSGCSCDISPRSPDIDARARGPPDVMVARRASGMMVGVPRRVRGLACRISLGREV